MAPRELTRAEMFAGISKEDRQVFIRVLEQCTST